MLKRRIPTFAVTGITIAAVAALVTLGTTGASAATTTAPAHLTVSAAHAAADTSGCVTENFSTADQYTYQQCVADAQVLFNDLYYYEQQHPVPENRTYLGVNQLLATDGSYGPDTAGVVGFFQQSWNIKPFDRILGPHTWDKLCSVDSLHGFRGVYWHDVGCGTEPGL
jgi:peptidoglycan hydrolase-like protein with peptidoglycan-binding domain